jgi:hypothetical protein
LGKDLRGQKKASWAGLVPAIHVVRRNE